LNRPLRWSLGGRAPQQSVNADVLVDVWPVHSLAVSDDLPPCPLLGGSLREAPRPLERDADNPAIREVGDDSLVGHAHRSNARFSLGYSAHTEKASL